MVTWSSTKKDTSSSAFRVVQTLSSLICEKWHLRCVSKVVLPLLQEIVFLWIHLDLELSLLQLQLQTTLIKFKQAIKQRPYSPEFQAQEVWLTQLWEILWRTITTIMPTLLTITTHKQQLVKTQMQMVKKTFHLKVFFKSLVKSGQMRWRELEVLAWMATKEEKNLDQNVLSSLVTLKSKVTINCSFMEMPWKFWIILISRRLLNRSRSSMYASTTS